MANIMQREPFIHIHITDVVRSCSLYQETLAALPSSAPAATVEEALDWLDLQLRAKQFETFLPTGLTSVRVGGL